MARSYRRLPARHHRFPKARTIVAQHRAPVRRSPHRGLGSGRRRALRHQTCAYRIALAQANPRTLPVRPRRGAPRHPLRLLQAPSVLPPDSSDFLAPAAARADSVGRAPILVDETPLVVIEPRAGWAPLDLRELWGYRELLFLLAARDVKVRYKQTILGVAWA